MFPFFPAFQEDELLYSAVARYQRLSGWNCWSAALDALFGRRHVVAAHDLPGHLQALCDRLMPNVDSSAAVGDLIEHSTLLPYYISAASPAIRRIAIAAAAVGGGSSHLSLGLAVSCVPRLRALRFCSQCNEADLEAKGFTGGVGRTRFPALACASVTRCFFARRQLASTAWDGTNSYPLTDAPARRLPGL